MSCFVLSAESFESLYASLRKHCVTLGNLEAFVWSASEANQAAFENRYSDRKHDPNWNEVLGVRHPLGEKYGSLEAFSDADGRRLWKCRSPIATIKLIDCISYQASSADDESTAAMLAEQLRQLSHEMAHTLLRQGAEYTAAPWGDDDSGVSSRPTQQ